MATCTVIGADIPKNSSNSNKQILKRITINFGIFFDGTNNQRLQVLIGKKLRKKKNKGNPLRDEEKELVKKFALDGVSKKLKNKIPGWDKGDLKEEEIDALVKEHGFRLTGLSRSDMRENTDFTNIARMEPYYSPEKTDDTTYSYKIYVTGSGTYADLEKSTSFRGLGFGQGDSGVVQKVEDALEAIKTITQKIDSHIESVKYRFHLFGFSRGSTEARLFIDLCSAIRGGDRPDVLDDIIQKYMGNTSKVAKWKRIIFPKQESIEFPFVGIFDTVSSVGVNTQGQWNPTTSWTGEIAEGTGKWLEKVASGSFDNNVNDLGLNTMVYEPSVKKIVHICALDEFRENFSLILVPIESKVDQIFLPGAHADIGGGYLDGYHPSVRIARVDYGTISLQRADNMAKSMERADDFVSYNIPRNDLFLPIIPYPGQIDSNDCLIVNRDNLFNMGWLKEDDTGIVERDNYIIVERFSKDGYMYLPLQLLMTKVTEKLFSENISETFKIPYSLPQRNNNQIGWDEKKWLKKDYDKYGYIIRPKEKKDYVQLRKDFLHFSSDITEKPLYKATVIVNGPHINYKFCYERTFFPSDSDMRIIQNLKASFIGTKETREGEIIDRIKAVGNLVLRETIGNSVWIHKYKAVSGSSDKLFPLPNGNYKITGYRDRGLNSNAPEESMTIDNVGFSFDLSPEFRTNRSNLEIHPDGGAPGTAGCIGIVEKKERLSELRSILLKYIKIQNYVPLTVEIIDNPNCNTDSQQCHEERKIKQNVNNE